MRVVLANPRGFCAGVDRAITIVELALERYGAPIYVRHEIVHNEHVVAQLRAKGARFVETIEEIPEGSIVVYSAHGVSQAVRAQAQARGLQIFDATCPLVTKVHLEVTRASKVNDEVILIGHAGHVEVEGTMGQYLSKEAKIYLVQTIDDAKTIEVKDPSQLHVVTQTTLSVDDTKAIIEVLKQRFPSIHTPKRDDICYATQNRQDAVRALAKEVDLVLVVGSQMSSNSKRLQEKAIKEGVPAYLIDNASMIEPSWMVGIQSVGVTAGASAPEVLVDEVIARLKDEWGASSPVNITTIEENMHFSLPKGLREPVETTVVEAL